MIRVILASVRIGPHRREGQPSSAGGTLGGTEPKFGPRIVAWLAVPGWPRHRLRSAGHLVRHGRAERRSGPSASEIRRRQTPIPGDSVWLPDRVAARSGTRTWLAGRAGAVRAVGLSGELPARHRRFRCIHAPPPRSAGADHRAGGRKQGRYQRNENGFAPFWRGLDVPGLFAAAGAQAAPPFGLICHFGAL